MPATDLNGSRAVRATICAALCDDRGMPPVRDAAVFTHAANRLLDAWQILPHTGPRFLASTRDDHGHLPLWRKMSDVLAAVTAYGSAQIAGFRPFVEELQRRRLEFVLLKANAMRHLVYASPSLRTGWDLDVAVTPERVREAEACALAVGYAQAEFDVVKRRFFPADPVRRAQVEAQHYELGYLVRRQKISGLDAATLEAIHREPACESWWKQEEFDEPVCYVTVDVHFGLSLDIGVQDALRTASTSSTRLGDVPVPAMRWLAFHVMFKLYWETIHRTQRGLYQYADLLRLVPRITPEEWAGAEELLERFDLRAAGYYTLRRLPSAFNLPLPPPIAAFVDRCADVHRRKAPLDANDKGDHWELMWDDRAGAR